MQRFTFLLVIGMTIAPVAISSAQTSIKTGIDTTLPLGSGLNGPDLPHGEKGSNPDGVERWEWDGSDGGGLNQGVLWFDIPSGLLDGFVEGSTATLKLFNNNNGESGDAYRITEDWLTIPEGGDSITANGFPEGPGVIPGANAQEVSNFSTGVLTPGPYEFDVAVDVLAWASGEPNYGWGFLPAEGTGDGNGIISFEHETDPVPELVLDGLLLTNGDFNADGAMDMADYAIMRANMNTAGAFADGDFDFNGQVNLKDFIGFRRSFNAPVGAAVPEPSSLALFGIALAGLPLALRRRRV